MEINVENIHTVTQLHCVRGFAKVAGPRYALDAKPHMLRGIFFYAYLHPKPNSFVCIYIYDIYIYMIYIYIYMIYDIYIYRERERAAPWAICGQT